MNLAVTVALVPALFTTRSGGSATTVVRTASAGSVPIVAIELPPTSITTTTTTAPPPPTTTTTVARPVAVKPAVKAAPAPAPKPRPSTTTTTAPPPTPAAQGNTESGKGSWYDHVPGICAHKTLPFGTIVTVTNVANGRSVTCQVGDRGPFVEGWVIDLNPREFEQLAPRSAGVISVRLNW